MKYFFKKTGFILFVIISWFLAGLFSGCGCTSKKTTQENIQNKIVVWYWMNDRKDALEQLAQKYQEETGTIVDFKLISPPDIYSQKIIAAARTEKLPEIFGIIGEKKTLASFIEAGHILNLTPVMEEENNKWKDSFYPQALSTNTFTEGNSYGAAAGIYGVPIDIAVMQFAYNKTLFEEAGLDPQTPPKTFKEFLTFAKVIKDKTDAEGFTCGWGESWLLNCLIIEWAIDIMGENYFYKTLKGEIPYTDPKWIKTFSLLTEMEKSGILASNITTMINKEAEESFSQGKAGFCFNGTWAVNVYKQRAPDLDYQFFSLPKVSELPLKVWGGAGSAFMVNAKSPQKEKAIKFLKWLTSKQQQEFLIQETNNLPAIKDCEQKLPPVLQPLTKNIDNLTHPNIWPSNEESRVIETINQGLQQIVMGLKTPEQVAKEIEADKKGTRKE